MLNVSILLDRLDIVEQPGIAQEAISLLKFKVNAESEGFQMAYMLKDSCSDFVKMIDQG